MQVPDVNRTKLIFFRTSTILSILIFQIFKIRILTYSRAVLRRKPTFYEVDEKFLNIHRFFLLAVLLI